MRALAICTVCDHLVTKEELTSLEREQSFDDEASFQELVTATADMAEGMAAFRDRRPPEYQGW